MQASGPNKPAADTVEMGRHRKASLINGGSGRLIRNGRQFPGYYVRYSEYLGEARIQRSKHFTRLDHARKWVRRYNARQQLGQIGEVLKISLADAADEWTDGAAAMARETLRGYNTALGLLEALVGEHVAVCAIDGRMIDKFIRWRLEQSSEATAAKHLRFLHAWFAWCVQRSYAATNPVDHATSRPSNKHVRTRPPVSRTQLDALVAALDTEDRKLAVWLAITTGLDRGVIESLSAQHIDLTDRCIRIVRPKTARRSSKIIVAPLHARLLPALAARLPGAPPSRPLLRGIRHQGGAADWWYRAREAAGLPDLMFRDLRAVASVLLQREAGMSLTAVQQLLGHASITTTAAHYSPPDPDALQKLDSLRLPGSPAAAKPSAG